MSPSDAGPPDRRRHPRAAALSRESAQRALISWRLLSEAWTSIASAATSARNWERLALAEAKLDECRLEIARLEKALAHAV
jgi:type VI protein secretion system component VasF